MLDEGDRFAVVPADHFVATASGKQGVDLLVFGFEKLSQALLADNQVIIDLGANRAEIYRAAVNGERIGFLRIAQFLEVLAKGVEVRARQRRAQLRGGERL